MSQSSLVLCDLNFANLNINGKHVQMDNFTLSTTDDEIFYHTPPKSPRLVPLQKPFNISCQFFCLDK